MNNREAFEAWVAKFRSNVILRRFENGDYVSAVTENYFNVWQAALEQANVNEQSQTQQPTNVWQQAIDDELVNAHLGVARNEVTREEAKAQLNALISWHIDVAKYFESQAQQSQWISVEERLPDSIREVIGAYWHEEIERFQPIFCCYDADDDDEWISYGDATPYPIRYWMEPPLPPAPEGDKP